MILLIQRIFILSSLLLSFASFGQKTRWSNHFDKAIIYSSPRFIDLNKDSVLDIIVGAGNEYSYTKNGVIAIDGKTGNVLWKCQAPTQIYTSALFQDITGDGIEDVFIGGRSGQFYAIDGTNGQFIWRFFKKEMHFAKEQGVFNFCAVQFIDDQNNDGFKELLVANGGDASALPGEKKRPQGKLMVLDAKTGATIAESFIPENREIYYAPHVHYNYGKDSASILFGTGGEDIDGKLWEVSLTELMNNDIRKARVLLTDSLKGFIVSSVMVDLNKDGIVDIVNARINGGISAIDGINHQLLWQHSFPGFESYTSPTVGQFTGDETPDIFLLNGFGKFPEYAYFNGLIIDGKSGEIVYEEYAGIVQFGSALAADINADGYDEVIYIQNYFDTISQATSNQARVIDFHSNLSYCFGDVHEGTVFSCTPALIDLEGDGKLEFIYSHSNSFLSRNEYSEVECLELEWFDPAISYPIFLGIEGNGLFEK